MSLDLTNEFISDTYQRVVQYDAGNFYDGLGNLLTTYSSSVDSASFALFSISSSYSSQASTASYVATASWSNNSVTAITASYIATASNAVTASYALTTVTKIAKSDYTGSLSYCGLANSGSADSDLAWRITKITISPEGNATSSIAYNAAWSNRYNVIYS